MYNRYIRNDNGSYTRIPEEEPRQGPPEPPKESRQSTPPPQNHGSSPPPQTNGPPPPQNHGGPTAGGTGRVMDSLTGFLRHMLDQLHLDHVDTGDLLLLALLFFLFREDADEELLVSLGLLLIL